MNEILVEVDDPVATITLNRPETLNALTLPMLAAFREAVENAAGDPRVVGIVVTGAGRGFCSGLDASVLQPTTTTGSSSRPTIRRRARAVHVAAVDPQAGHQRRQRRRRRRRVRPGRDERPADRVDGRLVHHDLLQARPHRRARHDLDRAPAHRNRRGARSAVVVTQDRRRRSAPHRARAAGGRARRPRRRRAAVRRRPRRERVAGLARRHQTPGLRGIRRELPRRARHDRRRAVRRPRPRRRQGGRGRVDREATAELSRGSATRWQGWR